MRKTLEDLYYGNITALGDFVLGFRLGVRMIAECMDNNDGDIREVTDYG